MQHCTKYSHPRTQLNFEDRLRFEKDWNRLVVHHHKEVTILGFAKKHGISSTLWRRELRRCNQMKPATVNIEDKVKGRVLYDYPLYNAEVAQADAEAKMKNKGPRQRMTVQMADKISTLILNDKMSPYCAYAILKNSNPDAYIPCWRTIYNYLDSGEMNAKRGDTPYHPGKLKRKKSKAHPARTVPGRKQIGERPQEASDRKEIGHWEMDTVTSCAGKKGGVVCLVERVSRKYVFEPIKSVSQAEVGRALKRLIKRNAITGIKSVTTDNGCEFLDDKKLEKLLGCNVYYTRAYASYEKGSVENANRILRRWYPKGTDFNKVDKKQLMRVESLINNMLRKSLNGKSANQVFSLCA